MQREKRRSKGSKGSILVEKLKYERGGKEKSIRKESHAAQQETRRQDSILNGGSMGIGRTQRKTVHRI